MTPQRGPIQRSVRAFSRACLVAVVRAVDPLIDKIQAVRRDKPRIYGERSRVTVAPSVRLNDATLNTRSGRITIEDDAFFGHQVMVLTGRHAIDRFGQDRQATVAPAGCDVIIRRGAWVASRAILIGPCEIGEHAVVAAGSVVTRSVPAYGIAAGVPARIIGSVPTPTDGSRASTGLSQQLDRDPDTDPGSTVPPCASS